MVLLVVVQFYEDATMGVFSSGAGARIAGIRPLLRLKKPRPFLLLALVATLTFGGVCSAVSGQTCMHEMIRGIAGHGVTFVASACPLSCSRLT